MRFAPRWHVMRHMLRPEVFALIVLGVYYAFPYLDFNPDTTLSGREAQRLAGPILPFFTSLQDFGRIPHWNPYRGTGAPMFASPFMYLFNIPGSLPFALFEPAIALKVSVTLALLVTALGGWLIAYALDLKPFTRLYLGAFLLINGALASKLQAGYSQMAWNMAWAVCATGFLLLALRKKHPIAPMWAGLTFALVFLSGVIYYTLPTGVSLLIVALFYMVNVGRDEKGVLRVTVNRWAVRVALLAGVFGLGFAMIQFLPTALGARHLGHITDPGQAGSQPIRYILVNFLIDDRAFYRNELLGKTAYLSEHYAFVGLLPFVLLLALPVLYWKRREWRREILLLAVLNMVLVQWVANRYTYVGSIYKAIPFLNQFKYPGRMIMIETIYLLTLSAIGFDALWQALGTLTGQLEVWSQPPLVRLQITWKALARVALVAVAAVSMRKVMLTNRQLIYVDEIEPHGEYVIAWVTYNLPRASRVLFPDCCYELAVYERRMNSIMLDEGWMPLGMTNSRLFGPAFDYLSNYVIRSPLDPPDWVDPEPLFEEELFAVYRVPGSLPYAFVVSQERVTEPLPLLPDERQEVRVTFQNTDIIVIDQLPEDTSGQVLVLTETAYPGWRVWVDDEPTELYPVNRFLGVQLPSGARQVTFSYHTPGWWPGVTITLLTCAGAVSLVVVENRRAHARAGPGEATATPGQTGTIPEPA
jgi:hypothetical protein